LNSDERRHDMDNKNKALILVIVVLSLALLYWSVSASTKSGAPAVKEPTEKEAVTNIPEHSEESFKSAQEAESPDDPCAAPEGYTEDAWKEHMGHHPGMYKDCL
jgi:hypothetical protein